MVLELAAVISGVNAATTALSKVAAVTQDVSSISEFLGTLGQAQYDLGRIKNTKTLTAADAIKHQLCQKQVNDCLAEIKDIFLVSGNMQLWDAAQAAMAESRKARAEEIKRAAAARKKLIKELKIIGLVVLICIFIVPVTIYLLIQRLMQ
jgi:hypothetical protein